MMLSLLVSWSSVRVGVCACVCVDELQKCRMCARSIIHHDEVRVFVIKKGAHVEIPIPRICVSRFRVVEFYLRD